MWQSPEETDEDLRSAAGVLRNHGGVLWTCALSGHGLVSTQSGSDKKLSPGATIYFSWPFNAGSSHNGIQHNLLVFNRLKW